MGGLRALSTPLSLSELLGLRAGDLVKLSGRVVVARDRAHARLIELHDKSQPPPVELSGAVLFHAGPLALKVAEGWRILSIGPTTSARFEELAVEVARRFKVGAVIGKGGLSPSWAVKLREANAVYLAYPGGAGVLAAKSVVRVLEAHWLDLGIPEALWVLEVKELAPLLVAIDLHGGNLYEETLRRALGKLDS
ncbi:MAG: FumA C-terminus/TtdB family hydratase beta subunit [Candidatus Nezhaarchaeota archaeon]|nr:FumA C-terminus/TtdB family hydratase beta subunit [Candidatus Nezhaarchaeota archaeon]